ncbi:MAG: hypothetical protein KGV43_00215 [Arcobacter sp.]|nr:hypothetical protein [Arcobacter sp.]
MDYQLSKKELRETKVKRENFRNIKRNPIVCILDNLQDSYNIGNIIRLCEAFLIDKIYLCGISAKIGINKKVKISSKGTDKWIDIVYKESTKEAIEEIKSFDYKIYAVELSKYSTPYYDTDLPKKIAFVLGNENRGISSDILNLCHKAIHIPMYGMSNSINVCNAASIIISNSLLKIKNH